MNATEPNRRSRGPESANPPTVRSRVPRPSSETPRCRSGTPPPATDLAPRHASAARLRRVHLPDWRPAGEGFLTRAHGGEILALVAVASPTALRRAASPASAGSRPWCARRPGSSFPRAASAADATPQIAPHPRRPGVGRDSFLQAVESRRTVPRRGRVRSALIAPSSHNGLPYDSLPARVWRPQTAHFVQSRHR